MKPVSMLSGCDTGRAAGRIELRGEIVAELRRGANDDRLGAVVRTRLPSGELSLWIGPDLPQRQVGSALHVRGYWDHDTTRGSVFRVEDLVSVARPHESRAVAQYLAANIPGLGRKRAARLVSTLGANVLDRLCADPALVEPLFAGGTGIAIGLAIREWAAEQQRDTVAHLLTSRLTSAGVTYGIVRRVVRHFSSADAAAVVTLRHPYRLVDVPGVGWKTADLIAQRLGVAEDDPARYAAACHLALRDAVQRGNTGSPRAKLAAAAAKLLGVSRESEVVLGAVERLIVDGHALDVSGMVGEPELVALEAELADRVVGALLAAPRLSADQESQACAILSSTNLSSAQRNAVLHALSHGVSVLTGRPGAGKTTTIKAIVDCAKQIGWRVQIVAPTGKAASRAAVVTGVSASTVHRLLAREPLDAPTPLHADLVIVDESSMCDLETATWLMRAIDPRRGTRVIWCGDADQLPSVGAGQVLADLIASGVVPTTHLSEVFRQATGSPIIRNANRLLDELPLDLTSAPGWRFVRTPDVLAGADAIVLGEVQALIAVGHSPVEIQVLAPMRRGPLGVEQLNRSLQTLLNPGGASGPYVGGGVRVRVGDRVVATRNVYDLAIPVFNGEQGIVIDANRSGHLRVNFGDREVTLTGVQCLMVRLAWAMTVHRAQGSEYPAVVLAYDHRAHGPMLDLRLLYTAITRARSHVTFVGTEAALRQTYGRARTSMRHTTLTHHLETLLHPLRIRGLIPI